MTTKATAKAAPAPKKVPALQVNAVKALHLTPEDLTADGIKALQGSTVGGAARVALAVYVSPITSGMPVRSLGDLLGVGKTYAGHIRNAGAILARCGASAADQKVAQETLALVTANQHKGLDGKSGPALVRSISATYVAFRKSENTTRGAGALTASEKAAKAKADAAKQAERDAASVAKATNAQRIGGAVLFLQAVAASGASDVTEEQVANLFTVVSELSAIVAERDTAEPISA